MVQALLHVVDVLAVGVLQVVQDLLDGPAVVTVHRGVDDPATRAAIAGLIELIEEEVQVRLGFQLEREVILVGEW